MLADPVLERRLVVGHDAGLDHRGRQVRTADGGIPRDRANPLHAEVEPLGLHPRDHELGPATAFVAQPRALGREGGVVRVGPVTEHVDADAAPLGGELHAGHEGDAGAGAGVGGLGPAVDGVVVGEREDRHALLLGHGHVLRGRGEAVGMQGVGVKVRCHA